MKKELTVAAFLDKKVGANVLRVLIQLDMPLPISRIAEEISSNYVTVRRHVKILEDNDLVISVGYGKRTLYRPNFKNPRIAAFSDFIETWDAETVEAEAERR